MSHDNDNNDDNKLDINIDIQQPPRKKRKGLKTGYSEFPLLYLLLRKVMYLFSGIVDVERQNEIKKWICTAKRDRLLTSTLDMSLRTFCNSPDENDAASVHVWHVEVAKAYWKAADRNIDCKELDVMCDIDNDK